MRRDLLAIASGHVSKTLPDWLAKLWRQHRTRRVLEQLTERQLADVGLLDTMAKRPRRLSRPFWWLPHD